MNTVNFESGIAARLRTSIILEASAWFLPLMIQTFDLAFLTSFAILAADLA